MRNGRFVLVRTKFPGNLGAAARVMRNFGLTDLVLVSPEANRFDQQARQMATHGEEILERARVVESLEEAVSDCVWVVGTSARVGGPMRRQTVGPPDVVLAELAQAATSGPTAVVFGPETNGLTDGEVSRCHALLHVPTDRAYPALNLAQSVAICAYELAKQAERGRPSERRTSFEPDAPVPHGLQEKMFADLRGALEAIHFLYDERATRQFHALRHLIGRARPTEMEVKLLIGLARQLHWIAKQPQANDDVAGR